MLETEKENVDIKRDIKPKAQITGILSRYQQEINETVMNIEQKELYYITEETKDQNENPEVAENENHAIPEDEDKENINNEFEAG